MIVRWYLWISGQMILNMEQKRKHKGLWIAGIVLAVVAVLGAAGVWGFTALGNAQLEADSALEQQESTDETIEKVTITDDELSQLINGNITLDSIVQGAGSIAFESDETDGPAQPEENAGSEDAASSQQSAASGKAGKTETVSSSSAESIAAAESKPQKTQPAASEAEKPQPAGYETEIKALIQQVYAVKARGESGLNASIAAAKAEYKALPENQKTQARKIMIVLSKTAELNALQSSCDKEMDSIVSQMRKILQENGQSTALADQVMAEYKAEKSARYTELKNKLYS